MYHPHPETLERLEERNASILEKWQLGWSRQKIAAYYGLTSARISQVVLSFGIRERQVRPRQTDRQRPSS
jgi:hypothetical protein